jgi:hypothetical protein
MSAMGAKEHAANVEARKPQRNWSASQAAVEEKK